MSPAEARDALGRAFPGMEWTVYDDGSVRGERGNIAVDVYEVGGEWWAEASTGSGSRPPDPDPTKAARMCLADMRAHLTAQLAAIDAADVARLNACEPE